MQLIPGAMGDTVWDVLSNAAIDWKIDDNGSAYVTSLDFPFWFDVLGGDEGFYFYTYCSVREGGGEAELLRSVNDCNLGLPMLQFSASTHILNAMNHSATGMLTTVPSTAKGVGVLSTLRSILKQQGRNFRRADKGFCPRSRI